jgi:hypothetical protein
VVVLTAQSTEIPSMSSVDMGCPLNAGLSCYNTESITVGHSLCGVWKASLCLHINADICRFPGELAVTKGLSFRTYPSLRPPLQVILIKLRFSLLDL